MIRRWQRSIRDSPQDKPLSRVTKNHADSMGSAQSTESTQMTNTQDTSSKHMISMPVQQPSMASGQGVSGKYPSPDATHSQKRKALPVVAQTEVRKDAYPSASHGPGFHGGNSRSGERTDGRQNHARERRRRHKDRSDDAAQPSSDVSNATLPVAKSLSPLWAWIDHIPQSADDRTIVGEMNQIFVTAEQYIENFYDDITFQRADLAPLVEAVGFSSMPPEGSVKSLLSIVAHPTTILKHALNATLLAVIDLENKDRLPSLLPTEFVQMARAVRHSDKSDDDIMHSFEAFSAWRVLGHYLRRNVRYEKSYIGQRDRAIEEIVADIEETFQPWLRKDCDQQKRGPVLVGLLQKTAEVGLLLFSQPSTFYFDWGVAESFSQIIEIAVTPRMVKVCDENAQDIEHPQLMFEVRTEKTKVLSHSQQYQEKVIDFRDQNPINDKLTNGFQHDLNLNLVELPADSNKHAPPGVENAPICNSDVHEMPGEMNRLSRQISSTISGPEPNMPAFEHSHGEGPSIYGLGSRELVVEHSTSPANGLAFQSGEKPMAEVDEFSRSKAMFGGDRMEYKDWQLNVERRRSWGLTNNGDATNRHISDQSPGQTSPARRQPPPSSYTSGITPAGVRRSESLNRGRGADIPQQRRARSRSEQRNSTHSSNWLPDNSGGTAREEEILHSDPTNLSGYATKRFVAGKTREQRDANLNSPPQISPGPAYPQRLVISGRPVEQKPPLPVVPHPDSRPRTSAGSLDNLSTTHKDMQARPSFQSNEGSQASDGWLVNRTLREQRGKQRVLGRFIDKWAGREVNSLAK